MRYRQIGELKVGATRVLDMVELDQVYVLNTRYETRDRTQDPPFRVTTEVRVAARSTETHVEVWARYSTEASKEPLETDGGDSPPAAPVSIWIAEVEGVAMFESSEPPACFDVDDLEAFSVLVGAPAIHPYAREWTQTLTSQSQYPAFTLGLMRSFSELGDDHQLEFPDVPEEGTITEVKESSRV